MLYAAGPVAPPEHRLAQGRPYLVNFDPIAFSVGPLDVHWYGIMYLLGFATFWWLATRRAGAWGWSRKDVDDLLFYGVIGVILGGRLGYVLFYDLANVAADPLRLIRVWEGGMSFHGGLLGVLGAMAYFAARTGRSLFQVTDFIAPISCPGLGFGRLGNFIGGELWGRPTDVGWGVIFPRAIEGGALTQTELQSRYAAGLLDDQARHPSQLYQAGLEGIVLFAILMAYARSNPPRMALSGLFALLYGLFRFSVEFVREPDAHLRFIAFDWLTMGQVLSLPLIVLGAVLLTLAYRRGIPNAARADT